MQLKWLSLGLCFSFLQLINCWLLVVAHYTHNHLHIHLIKQSLVSYFFIVVEYKPLLRWRRDDFFFFCLLAYFYSWVLMIFSFVKMKIQTFYLFVGLKFLELHSPAQSSQHVFVKKNKNKNKTQTTWMNVFLLVPSNQKF